MCCPLYIVGAADRDLRRVGIAEEVMPEFVGQTEAAAWVYGSINPGGTHIPNLDICGITASLSKVEAERQEADAFAGALEVAQRAVWSVHEGTCLGGECSGVSPLQLIETVQVTLLDQR